MFNTFVAIFILIVVNVH